MRKTTILTLAFVLTFVITIFFYLLIIERDPQLVPSALIDKKIPIFTSESLLKDEIFTSEVVFENKKVLVNFFASWCKPCLQEHSFIKLLSKNKNLKIVGINYKDNVENTKKWLTTEGNPYSEIAIDKKGSIAIDWGVYGIPETFLVNSKGIIKYRHIGPITKKVYQKIESIISEMQ